MAAVEQHLRGVGLLQVRPPQPLVPGLFGEFPGSLERGVGVGEVGNHIIVEIFQISATYLFKISFIDHQTAGRSAFVVPPWRWARQTAPAVV